jgi:hypothetical protein
MQASHRLAEAVYQQAQQEAPHGDGGNGDEHVEEGDYEVIDEEENK